MKRNRSSLDGTAAFRRRYLQALRARVKPAAESDPDRARRLGLGARQLGIGPLALARIHEAALASVALRIRGPRALRRLAVRAAAFFTEALDPIEATRRPETGTRTACLQTGNSADRGVEGLAAAILRGTREASRRKAAQKALRTSRCLHRVLLERSHAMEEQLRQLSRNLLRSHEEERMRISRELHDALGQTLAGIQIGLAGLELGSRGTTREFRRRIARTRGLVLESMQTVHRFARDLRPMLLDDLGLVPALHGFAQEFGRRNGLRVRVSAPGASAPLDTDRRTALFRVAQEALINADRHARARNVRLTLRQRPGAVRMEIWNDGRVFDVERMRRVQKNRRLGILCMQERVEMVGGRLSIESSPGEGTTVRAEVPLTGKAGT
jgi:signal transduction histidine kinase